QTLFFTATMPPEIRRITETFLHNPEKIEVSKPASTAVTVTQSQVPCGREPHEKRETLRRLIRAATDLQNAIIFCNRKREVALLAKSLQKHGFSVGALHGDMDQSARTAALDQFRKGELPILVASDVAARGLDIPEVSHVFNFDVPHHPDDYVHRVGRTGRAGRLGTAISIVAPSDQKSIAAIEKLIGKEIPHADAGPASDAEEETERPARSSRRPSESRSRAPRGEDGPREAREPRRPRRGEPRKAPEPSEARETVEVQEPRREPREPRKPRREPRPASVPAPAAHASFGSAPPSRERESASEPADHSHLPAFLLRPVRARG
ncbi:DEAD/DEAH box helicase, partial [Rhodopseudomonas palustris]|nr:DEAD/DEAH box helicase [Rhodopseudomonas palustris]